MSNKNICQSHHDISFQRRKFCLLLEEFHKSRQQWTAKIATGRPEIPQTTELLNCSDCGDCGDCGGEFLLLTSCFLNAYNTSYCMECKCM